MFEKVNRGIGNKTIKIVFMINVKLNSGGGMERTLLSFIRYIPPIFRNIYDITIVQTTGLDKERIKEDEIYKILKTNNVKLITLDNYNRNSINLKIWLLTTIFNAITEKIRNRLCKNVIKEITLKSDIVYLFHNSFSSFIPKGPIVIGSFHERNLNPKAYGKLTSFLMKITLALIRSKILFKRIDYYHYQSNNYKPYMPKNSFYIPLGINTDEFTLKNNKDDKNEIIRILFVGRLVKSKGIDIVIEAFKSIQKMKKDGQYELHIVGSGGDMESYIRNLKIKGFYYHGQLSNDELIKIYSKCDIFVFPSRGDIFGLVVLEAISLGAHAIVNNSLKGVFDDFERIGVLEYSDANSEEISNRILKFRKGTFNNKDVLNQLLKKYDWREIDNKLYTLFQTLFYEAKT